MKIHGLLERQLKKYFGGPENIPKEFKPLIESINQAYHEYDKDYVMAERSLQISSEEMLEVMNNLQSEIAMHKKTEKELRETNEKLKSTQAQLFQAERLETVGRLASGVAHEVKNPLMMILQNVEYISKQVSKSDKNLQTAIKNTIDAIRRADTVVKGLLDFSSMSKVNMRQWDINKIIDSSVLLMKHQFDKNKIIVYKNFNGSAPKIKLDKLRIEQVLINLFVNAIQAMPKGGTITVSSQVGRIKEGDSAAGRREDDPFRVGQKIVLIEIEDEGVGISPKFLSKVYDPFFTTKKDKEGTGLGLSIIKNIIDLHKGHVELKNKKEGGVIATVILPVT